MDCWVWTDGFGATASDHRPNGPKSGYLDYASSVSAWVLPIHDFLVNWGCFKANWNDLSDAICLVPRTRGAQEG